MRRYLLSACVVIIGFPAPGVAQRASASVGPADGDLYAARLGGGWPGATPLPPRSPTPAHGLDATLQPATSPRTSRAAVDVIGGYAGFIDESLVDHAIVGITVRRRLSRIISIGPEIVYMVGPGEDRDLFVTGNAAFDFLVPPDGPHGGTFNPFLVVGGGFMVHRSRFGGRGFSAFEGALTGGAGARVWITERVYAMGEYRVGWEPHVRLDGGIGIAW